MDVTFQLSWCLNEPPVLLSEQERFLSPDADRKMCIRDRRTNVL